MKMVTKPYKLGDFVRIIILLALVYGSLKEAGVFTSLALLLIFFVYETNEYMDRYYYDGLKKE
jgi:hypothetical protein